MPEFGNPSFLRLGVGVALAFGSLLPEVLQLQFGALELALEAPELFLGVPEMVPAMELELLQVRELAREPVTALEFVPVKDLVISQGIAQSNQLVQSSQPWFSSSMADHLTWLNIALPAALVAPASLEEGLVSTAKALEQVLEQNLDLAPFADSFCGLKGMKTLPLAFVPFWNSDLWPALLNGEDDRRHGRRGLAKKMKGLREWCSDF
uniref:Uncharacterized protein n=1 Tax=Vitis vinifera TaxID=29760 RepID=A5B0R2_VITVI|nr:hypothetical protein VITISV_021522 [Vitis vinifera]